MMNLNFDLESFQEIKEDVLGGMVFKHKTWHIDEENLFFLRYDNLCISFELKTKEKPRVLVNEDWILIGTSENILAILSRKSQ
jgi:hypothetical protein